MTYKAFLGLKILRIGKEIDDNVYLIQVTTGQWVTKSISIQNQPERNKYKMKSIMSDFDSSTYLMGIRFLRLYSIDV
jgi:hypothetical protein